MKTRSEYLEFNLYRAELKKRIQGTLLAVAKHKISRRKIMELRYRVLACRCRTLAGLKRYDRERKKIEAEYTLWKMAN